MTCQRKIDISLEHVSETIQRGVACRMESLRQEANRISDDLYAADFVNVL
jgi:hypothetical protein